MIGVIAKDLLTMGVLAAGVFAGAYILLNTTAAFVMTFGFITYWLFTSDPNKAKGDQE